MTPKASPSGALAEPGAAPAVVVITGASSGIGRGAARAFAERGANLVLAGRSEVALAEVARECRELGGRTLAVPTDVSDEAAVQELTRRAVAEFGRIDVWVNAAAVWSYGRFEDTPPAVFRRIVETTLFGQIYSARAVLPQFRVQRRGVLINIASLYGRLSSPYVSPYVTAKWGLVGFSEVLRQELRDAPGISVCTILPGAVDTPIYRHAADYTGREIRPLPPVLGPERVVAAILRAAEHPEAEIIVGQAQRAMNWMHRVAPRLYDRLVGPLVDQLAFTDAAASARDGNVFSPDPQDHGVDGGWRKHDHRRMRRMLPVGAGLLVLGLATAGLVRTGTR